MVNTFCADVSGKWSAEHSSAHMMRTLEMTILARPVSHVLGAACCPTSMKTRENIQGLHGTIRTAKCSCPGPHNNFYPVTKQSRVSSHASASHALVVQTLGTMPSVRADRGRVERTAVALQGAKKPGHEASKQHQVCWGRPKTMRPRSRKGPPLFGRSKIRAFPRSSYGKHALSNSFILSMSST